MGKSKSTKTGKDGDSSKKDGTDKKSEDKSKKGSNKPKDKSDKKNKKTTAEDKSASNKTKAPPKAAKAKAKDEKEEEQDLNAEAGEKDDQDDEGAQSPKTSKKAPQGQPKAKEKKTAKPKKLVSGEDNEEDQEKEGPGDDDETKDEPDEEEKENEEQTEDSTNDEVTSDAIDQFPPPTPGKQKQKPKEKNKDKSKKDKIDKPKEDKTRVAKKAKDTKAKEEKTKTDKDKSKSKPKETEQLEFTKPTINQMVREKKKKKEKKELSTSEVIENREFEDFNDEVIDLNSSIQMLRLSYGSIIKSLVALYSHREKKGKQQAKTKEVIPPEKVNFITTLGEVDGKEMLAKATCLQSSVKYDLERFINPVTREETFNMLFDEVKMLNSKTDKLRTKFYDSRGYFLREKYDQQKDIKVQRKQFNEFWLWTRQLAAVVEKIARNFNDDLLNYFRLH